MARASKISDVAQLAGVSVATVSRALAEPGVVSAKTLERVLKAVRETGYTPNVAARSLRARKSMMVLVVVPDIANPFFSEVLRGIDETLSAAGYGLIIANLGTSRDLEARYADMALAGQVDGVLFLCGRVIAGTGRALQDARLPMVAICERIPGETMPQVEIDNRGASRVAVEHLLGLGHQRFAFIAGPPDNILTKEREAGFRAALAEASLPPEAGQVLAGDFTFFAGRRAAETIFGQSGARRPTGIFAANDEMAIGFTYAVQEAGFAVPQHFSVVGFDGIAFSDFCRPRLTTLVQPRRELGAQGAHKLVVSMTDTTAAPPSDLQLEAVLSVRESTGPAPGQ